MNRRALWLPILLLGLSKLNSGIASPHPTTDLRTTSPNLEEIVVYGRSTELVGQAYSASAGIVGYDDIDLPPLLRTGELVESVPGMVATQHSGTGKANQYFLRGFNLDHGTDFSAKIEGVPINMRTHGHGQGYLDLNFLIPEMIATTRYRKGPYSAAAGDFSSAGSVSFDMYQQLSENLLEVSFGEDGYQRLLALGSATLGSGDVMAAIDSTRYDGPWVKPEDSTMDKWMLRYVRELAAGQLILTGMGYQGEWDATDQIPRRAVADGRLDPLGFIDPDLGGETTRYAINAAFNATDYNVNVYMIDYDFTLFSNFTYGLEDPVQGDQFEQRDERRVFGGSYTGRYSLSASSATELRWGLVLRHDDISDLGLFPTASRERLGVVRSDQVRKSSVGAYGELAFSPIPKLRGVLGLRADRYHWNVDARQAINSGSGNDSLISPSLSLAYEFRPGLEGYFNYGRGMHSNDVRGATIQVDPVSGDPVENVDVLVPTEGSEIGLRIENGPTFNLTAAVFWLEIDSELVFVGDAGGTEPNDGSSRYGLELATFWNPLDWLALNASYTYTDSSYEDVPRQFDAIPGSVESTFSMGINTTWGNGLSASLRLRYLGSAPLTEDDTARTDSSTLVNAGLIYNLGRTTWRLDVFNLFDSTDDDIAYYYASRLPGEPADGIDDVHFHPLEPRTARLSFGYRF